MLYALGEAGKDSAKVDPGIALRATTFLTTYVNRQVDVAKPADPSEKAFLYFALAEAGSPLVAQMRALVEQYRAQLTNSGKAYLMMGLTQPAASVPSTDPLVTQLLNDLAAQIIPSATGNHWEDQIGKDSYRNYPAVALRSTQATAVVLDALVRVQPGHPLIEETVRWLMSARTADGWTTSPERAQAILSLSEFAAKTGELAGDFTYEATLGSDSLLKGAFKPGDGATANQKTQSLAGTTAGKVTPLSISKLAGSPGRLYYTLALRYLTPAKEVEAVNRGFAISHRYSLLDDASKPITQAKIGDVVRVTVTVLAPADQQYVVVDDALPAGLEPIDPRLKTTDAKLQAQLAAEQAKSEPAEDRRLCGALVRLVFHSVPAVGHPR